jgi:hypothetical protein
MTFLIAVFLCITPLFYSETNSETVQSDWIWLFDGSNTNQWVSAKSSEFPKGGWTIENKTLVANKGGDKSKRGGDLISRRKFKNFDLRFEFKLTPGANSGLKYFVKKYPMAPGWVASTRSSTIWATRTSLKIKMTNAGPPDYTNSFRRRSAN